MARSPGLGGVESTVPAEEGLRRPSLEYRGPNTGAAIAGVANDAVALNAEIQKRDASSYAALQVPQAHVAAESAFLDAQQQPKDVIDKAGGLTPYVMQQFKQFADGAEKGAPNPLGQRMMREHLANVGASLQMKTMEADAQAQQTRRLAQASDGQDIAATAAQLNPGSWKDLASQQIAAYDGMGISEESRAKLSVDADAKIRAAAGRGFADKDPGSVLNRLNDPNDDLFQHFSLKEREVMQGYAKDKLAGNEADGIVNFFRSSNDAYKAGDALKAFNDNPNIPFDVKQVAQDKIRQGVASWQQDQRDKYHDTIINLEDRIGSGQSNLADRSTVLAMGKAGVYAPDRTGTLLGEIDRQQKKKVDDTVDLYNATQAYKNGTAVDPNDKGVKNGTNQLFNQLTANIPTGSQAWTNVAADIARKGGAVPEYAVDYNRTQLVSGDPDKAAVAADSIRRLQEASPRGVSYALDPKDKAMADSINRLVDGGADPVTAVQRARAITSITPAEEERLHQQFTAAVRGGKSLQDQAVPALAGLVKGDDRYKDAGLFGTGFFGHTPAPPPAMQGEFEDLRKDYYKYTGGDIKQANQMAYADLKHQWGVSEVNGPRELMRFAPETMNPGLTTEALRSDMVNAVKQTGVAPDMAAKAHLVPDSEATFHSQGQLWNLAVPNAAGLYEPVMGPRGRPLLYALPSAAESHAGVVQQQKQAGLEKARQMIATENQNQKDQIEEVQQAAQQGGGW